MRTRFADLVGCELPLQLAAMGGVGTTELAAAVVLAGGMGMVPAGVPIASGSCGVNFLLPFRPSLEDIIEAASQAPTVEFFYGDPRRDFVEAVHAEGGLVAWQIGSASEATAAEDAGCDYVVAQGIEAGGHIRGNQGLDELLAAVMDDVKIPVVAAGGVATAERFVALIGAGAGAVRVGTRFVTSPESGAHPDYVSRLLEAKGEDTELSGWFNQGWDGAPHRVLRACIQAAMESGWRATVPPNTRTDRDVSDMAMYAGMGVGDVTSALPAAEVVRDLVRLLD
ncbi:MAG: nitronate monooxygenase [Actinomycetota bacterium]